VTGGHARPLRLQPRTILTKGNFTANAHHAASPLAPAEVISESHAEVVGIRTLGLSQAELAQRLDVQQPAVSRLTSRSDMRISTLRDLIAAMGGELHVTAKFADRSVELANFD